MSFYGVKSHPQKGRVQGVRGGDEMPLEKQRWSKNDFPCYSYAVINLYYGNIYTSPQLVYHLLAQREELHSVKTGILCQAFCSCPFALLYCMTASSECHRSFSHWASPHTGSSHHTVHWARPVGDPEWLKRAKPQRASCLHCIGFT